ncbi:MAG: hypothetical protein ABI867_08100 [Kofleriaceae bacterium]
MDATFSRLEAALCASWDRDTLAVYADFLVERGDPRGELIVLDLELEGRSSPELVARRASLLSAWLGMHMSSNPHTSWIGDSFRFGFVEDLVIDGMDPTAAERLATTLASPLAPYLKRVTIRAGNPGHVAEVLRELSRSEHRWLTALSVAEWNVNVIDEATIAGFVAATPRLELLEVQGVRVFETFPHPGIQRLRVTGWSALPAMFFDDEHPDRPVQLANVTALDLAIFEPDDRFIAGQPSIGTTWPALALPALRLLDLARNEPETFYRGNYNDNDDDDDDIPPAERVDTTALGFLSTLRARKQLTHLRLASLRSEDDFRSLSAAVTGMPALVDIEVLKGHYYRAPELANSRVTFRRPAPWPWPRLAAGETTEQIHVLCPGSQSGDTVPLADAAVVMERRFENLAADVRYAWTRFWVFVDELGRAEWKTDATHAWTEDRAFPAEILVAALEACEIGGSGGWRELRDELRFRRPFPAGAMVTIHRVR